VGKAQRAHHFKQRSGEMVGTLRFAHPTDYAAIAFNAVAAEAYPPRAPSMKWT
jgi:hypothetical protein